MKKLTIILLGIFMLSCSSVNLKIDKKKYRAENYNERIQGIVLHYTAIDTPKSIRALTKANVSSHYLITDDAKDPIYSLVDDDKRAWHAGSSNFLGRTTLNDTTIGIEIVNLGYRSPKADIHPQVAKLKTSRESFITKEHYFPYDDAQIEKIGYLVKKLVKKYNINPKMVVGHSDIAPGRKKDPGPLFPWERLYNEFGIGAWYDSSDKLMFMNQEEFSQLNIKKIKEEFKKYGYAMPDTEIWDPMSVQVVYSFQMHFRPENIDGEVDLETYAILKALNKKYP